MRWYVHDNLGTKMKKNTLATIGFAAVACCLLALNGCSKEPKRTNPDEETTIALLSSRSVGGASGDYRPVFLFWKTGDVANISLTPYAQPYYVADNVPEDARSYETKRFNTQHSYPSDFSTLMATGYIPQDLVPTDDGSGPFYHALTLPAGGPGPGRTDLMAPQASLTGSLLDPFDDNGRILVFKHLQSLVEFRAICNDDFPASFYVDKVQIAVEATSLANGIYWNMDVRTYAVSAASGGDVTVGHGCEDFAGATLPIEVLLWYDSAKDTPAADENEYSDVGGIYILPNRQQLALKVSCRMYPSDVELSETEKEAYIKTAELTVTFRDGGVPIVLAEGESHLVTLFFAQDGIEVSGCRAEWEQGGNIIIPVVPE